MTAPIEDPEGRQRLLQILEAGLADTAKGRVLRSEVRDGSPVYERLSADGEPFRSQASLERLRSGSEPPELRTVPGGA